MKEENRSDKFTPKQWVLVRDLPEDEWALNTFSHYNADLGPLTLGGCEWAEVIPYEGNEHLLGNTDSPIETYEPKDGDFTYIEYEDGDIYIVCCKSCEPTVYIGYFLYDVMRSKILDAFTPCPIQRTDTVSIRPATKEEKNLLLSKLHEVGKDWDAEKKQIVPLRKIPKEYTNYWTIDFRFDQAVVVESTWTDSKYDLTKLDHNLVFENEATAQVRAQEINTLIHKQIETIW